MPITITSTPNAPAGGSFDPASPPALGVNEKIERRTSDGYLQAEVEKTNRSIAATQAAHADTYGRPRPSLKAQLTGRVAELWEPVQKRRLRGAERAESRADVKASTDPTDRVAAALRAQAEGGEAIDPDGELVTQVAEFARRSGDADAMAELRRTIRRQTAAALTEDIKKMSAELMAAVKDDLRDLAVEAEQIVDDLDGATSAEEAIDKGTAAVSAWKARTGVRDRALATAGSLHWIRRRHTRGFIVDRAGSPVGWLPGNDDRVSSATTWDVLDVMLRDLGVSDAATAVMIGEN